MFLARKTLKLILSWEPTFKTCLGRRLIGIRAEIILWSNCGSQDAQRINLTVSTEHSVEVRCAWGRFPSQRSAVPHVGLLFACGLFSFSWQTVLSLFSILKSLLCPLSLYFLCNASFLIFVHYNTPFWFPIAFVTDVTHFSF